MTRVSIVRMRKWSAQKSNRQYHFPLKKFLAELCSEFVPESNRSGDFWNLIEISHFSRLGGVFGEISVWAIYWICKLAKLRGTKRQSRLRTAAHPFWPPGGRVCPAKVFNFVETSLATFSIARRGCWMCSPQSWKDSWIFTTNPGSPPWPKYRPYRISKFFFQNLRYLQMGMSVECTLSLFPERTKNILMIPAGIAGWQGKIGYHWGLSPILSNEPNSSVNKSTPSITTTMSSWVIGGIE
jgi:hypothetical protein